MSRSHVSVAGLEILVQTYISDNMLKDYDPVAVPIKCITGIQSGPVVPTSPVKNSSNDNTFLVLSVTSVDE